MGRPGKNIPMDLHMEHRNRICKDAISCVGANKTPTAIQRVGKCIGVLKSVTDNFDAQTEDNKSKGYHMVASVNIIEEMLRHSIFHPSPGRCPSTFQNMKCSIFSKINYRLLLQCMEEHVPR